MPIYLEEKPSLLGGRACLVCAARPGSQWLMKHFSYELKDRKWGHPETTWIRDFEDLIPTESITNSTNRVSSWIGVFYLLTNWAVQVTAPIITYRIRMQRKNELQTLPPPLCYIILTVSRGVWPLKWGESALLATHVTQSISTWSSPLVFHMLCSS